MRIIKAFCLNNCPYSNNTKTLLSNFKDKYFNKDVDIQILAIDHSQKDELKKKYNHYTFPIILYENDNITHLLGGNEQLSNIFNKLETLNYNKLKEYKSKLSIAEYKILKWLYFSKLNII